MIQLRVSVAGCPSVKPSSLHVSISFTLCMITSHQIVHSSVHAFAQLKHNSLASAQPPSFMRAPTCTCMLLGQPNRLPSHSCCAAATRIAVRHHRRLWPFRRLQGGLLSLQRSERSKRASARAQRERTAVETGLKSASSTGILVTAALTAGAMVVGQVSLIGLKKNATT